MLMMTDIDNDYCYLNFVNFLVAFKPKTISQLELFVDVPGSPPLPDIYLSFEKTADGDSTSIPYDRGSDKSGNSQVSLKNDARIGTSSGRSGNVLRLQGRNAGGIIGMFNGHPIKYVENFH